MGADVMRAIVDGRSADAADQLGFAIHPDMFGEDGGAPKHFLGMLQREPNFAPWGPRAIVLADEKLTIGHIGFHTLPNQQYLEEYVGRGVEMGYTVFADYRRRGYASEAITVLAGWAKVEHGVENIVISVDADNRPSLALAEKLGFTKVGEHQDDVDGLEIVLSVNGAKLVSR
jgi:RimJ/RimL family protein N-acetyltransferase